MITDIYYAPKTTHYDWSANRYTWKNMSWVCKANHKELGVDMVHCLVLNPFSFSARCWYMQLYPSWEKIAWPPLLNSNDQHRRLDTPISFLLMLICLCCALYFGIPVLIPTDHPKCCADIKRSPYIPLPAENAILWTNATQVSQYRLWKIILSSFG